MGPGCGRRSAATATRGESGLTRGDCRPSPDGPSCGDPGRPSPDGPSCGDLGRQSPDGPGCGDPGPGPGDPGVEGVAGRGEEHGDVSAELADSVAMTD